jgi:hypothetical protein
MKNLTLLPISIALSILFYLFFLYTVPDYYGVAIFLFQLLFLVSLIHFKTTDTLAPQAALLIASTIILSGWFTIFTHPVIGVVNMLLLILVNLFLVTEIAGSSKDLSATFFGSLAQRLSFIPIWMDSIEPSLKNAKQSITIPNLLTSHKAVVREALISVGILAGILIVVIPLLSAADLGFAKVMQSVFDVFRID